MRKFLMAFLHLLFLANCFGQATEFRTTLYTSLFSFRGASAEPGTFINYSDREQAGAANNPYGARRGAGYGVAGDIQRVTKSSLIVGARLGYEVLRSKTDIRGISGYTGTSTYSYAASGQTFLEYSFINLHPFMGYRLAMNPVVFDVTGGVDIGYCMRAREKGEAMASNGTEYKTSVNRETIKTDIRPGLQVAAGYRKVGLFGGYARGLRNYRKGWVGGKNECYGSVWRLGGTYLLH